MLNNNTSKFWNSKNKSEFYSLMNSPIYLFKIKYVLDIVLKRKGPILNIGVGNGYLESRIQSKNSKLKLYGIDISDNSISRIKNLVRGNFVISNAVSIPFKSNSFDVVMALDILEHLTRSELNKVSAEIYRLIKRDGLFIVSLPLNENDDDIKNNRHMFKFEEDKICEVFDDLGFIVLKYKYVCAFKEGFMWKNLINNILNIKKYNLVILTCIKKD